MPCPSVLSRSVLLEGLGFRRGLWYHEQTLKGGGGMVLRTTFVVLCIVLGLALFSNSSEQENGWIWAAAVGVVVAGLVLGIEYMLRQAKPGVRLGGAAGIACGLRLPA